MRLYACLIYVYTKTLVKNFELVCSGHPMKPHRLAVTDSLVFNYKLHEHMKVKDKPDSRDLTNLKQLFSNFLFIVWHARFTTVPLKVLSDPG